MNDFKIDFIIAVNNNTYLEECYFYLSQLIIPEGYEVSVVEIADAKSMTSAYNEGMLSSDAKIKIYIHQDVFIINKLFLCELVDIFQKDLNLGMVGILGGTILPVDGKCYDSWNVGKLFANNSDKSMLIAKSNEAALSKVKAIDGLLMATQYDIPWREDIFDKWDFYDVSQSLEFKRKGYSVAVIRQDMLWCIHDCGYSKLSEYDKERKKLLMEYGDYFDSCGSADIQCDTNELNCVDDSLLKWEENFLYLSDEDEEGLINQKKLDTRNTRVTYLYHLLNMKNEDLSKYGNWKFSYGISGIDQLKDKLNNFRFKIWRVELEWYDISCLCDEIVNENISLENFLYIIQIVAFDAGNLTKKLLDKFT